MKKTPASQASHSLFLGDVYLHEDGTTLRFGNGILEIALSKETGNWLTLLWREQDLCIARGDGEMPAILLRVGGRRAAPRQVRSSRMVELVGEQTIGSRTSYVSHSVVCDIDTVTLDLVAEEGDWLITSHLTLHPGQPLLRRAFTIRYHGQGEALLRDVCLLVPGLQLGAVEETTIEAPGYSTRCHVPVTTLPSGIWKGLDSRPGGDPNYVQHDVDVPGSRAGLIGLHNTRQGLSLLAWARSRSEFCLPEVERRAGDLCLMCWLFVADRFRQDHALRAGEQILAIRAGTWPEALSWFQRQYEEWGVATPLDRPAWAGEATIYEVHIGAAPFPGGITYAPYPQVRDLIRDLPRIADLGFNTIQLMPHWPYCGYTVADYYDIDHAYGTEADVRELVRVAHAMGLRVLLDIVLHGCVDREIVRWNKSAYGARYDFIFDEWLRRAPERSPYRDEHPEWFMVDEDGETARVYTWAFDPANTLWQDFIIEVLSFYVRELGVDGFRFDAPTWNCMPNWDRGLPYRASASYYGAHTLFRRARPVLKALNPEVVMYTEPGGPLFRQNMDLNYNYDEEWLWASLVDVQQPDLYAGSQQWDRQRLTARELATWLHDRRLAMPAGSVTVHHLDSHDTFWWGEKARFRREALGTDAAQALFALCATLDGAVMSYVGAERGSEGFYQRILRLRRDISELRWGDCDYLQDACDDPMVLLLWRQWQGQHTLVLVNLADRDSVTEVRLPLSLSGLRVDQVYTIWDAFAGQLMHSGPPAPLTATLPRYGVAVWVIRPQ